MTRLLPVLVVLAATLLAVGRADAQPLGTFRWQLQPYCNVVTALVTQNGAVYTLDGYDDQCGAAQRAPLVGLATPNPDGTIGFGMNVVTVPGGQGVQIEARITLATLGGSWSDSAGNSGTFAFGASTGGSPRPAPTTGGGTTIPPSFALLNDGGFLARGTIDVGTIPASGSGTRMMWHPRRAAFRAGNVTGTTWDDASIGNESVAFNKNTTASGVFSAAFGDSTIASGQTSTAMGAFTTASGGASTAIGSGTTASGGVSTAIGSGTTASGAASTAIGSGTTASSAASTAMGSGTTASGTTSTAMGINSVASGANSTAMGANTVASAGQSTAIGFQTTASGVTSIAMGSVTTAAGLVSTVMGTFAATSAAAPGSFVYGDRSTVGAGEGVVTSISPNQFLVRAAGGVVFWSTAGTTFPTSPGVALFTGDSAWSTLSDVNSKENFTDLVGEDVLARIAQMPVREWNYKAQDAAIRHVGPTAQDFHAAFGLGVEPRRINTIDADGIALAAIKALETRTREMRDENRMLQEAVSELRRELAVLKSRR